MAVLANEILDPDAFLPSPTYTLDIAPGPMARSVALRRANVRNDLCSLMTGTRYWLAVVEREFPLLLLTAEEDDGVTAVHPDYMTAEHLQSAQAGIAAALCVTPVSIDIPDD